jgi:hypothetical protein
MSFRNEVRNVNRWTGRTYKISPRTSFEMTSRFSVYNFKY